MSATEFRVGSAGGAGEGGGWDADPEGVAWLIEPRKEDSEREGDEIVGEGVAGAGEVGFGDAGVEVVLAAALEAPG